MRAYPVCVLSVAKLARGREGYYLATVASGRDSPGGLVEPDGRWTGQGAVTLGLSGAVDGAALRALLAGVDPATGEVLSARHDRVRIVAYDCTYSAPKSVSLLHALGPEEVRSQVRAGHEQAAEAALGYLERHGARVRRRVDRGGAPVAMPAGGFVAAAFLHRTSRAPDPHLHSHVLVANLAQGPEGGWSALDGRGLYLELGTARDLYETQLRFELTGRLGVSWRELQGSWADLAGVDPRVNRAFSRRSTEIEMALEQSGLSGPRARHIASVRTRPIKDLGTSYEDLVANWRERSYRLGVSDRRLAAVATGSGPVTVSSPGERQVVSSWAETALGEKGVVARDGTCRRGDLVRLRCTSLPLGAPVSEVERDVETLVNDGRIVAVPQSQGAGRSLKAPNGRPIPAGVPETVYTTPDILHLHEHLERLVRANRGSVELLAYSPGGRLKALDELAAIASDPETSVLAVAPGAVAAASFEAVTGIETVAVSEIGAAPGPMPEKLAKKSIVVLAEAQRLGPWELSAALKSSLNSGSRLVLFAPSASLEERFCTAAVLAPHLNAFEPAGMSVPPAFPTSSLVQAERHCFAGHEVLVVGDGEAARQALLDTWRHTHASGRSIMIAASDTAVVAALRDSISSSGGSPDEVIEARHLAAALEHRGPGSGEEGVLAVLGPLPPRLKAMAGQSCVHVAIVAPHRSPAERIGRAAEVARPSYLVGELGPVPASSSSRAAWRDGARAIEAFRLRWSIEDPERAIGDRRTLRSLEISAVGDAAETNLRIRQALRFLGRASPELSRHFAGRQGPER